ncbi:MAG: hypothetical protein ABI140_03425 [Jatrophihabitantaceae bacterium]
MKRRSVQNDPISSTERDRGAVVRVNVLLDLEDAIPAATEKAPSVVRAKRD